VIWLGWRLQRTETLIAAGALLLLALALLPTGLDMASAYHNEGLASCLAAKGSGACGEAVASFMQRFDPIRSLVAWLTLLPGLIGVLLAAPFVLELEHGTYRLAWTQSITRRRWLAGKLGVAVGTAVVAALALTAFLTWWRAPLVHLEGRMDPSAFDSEGTVVVGYVLFALALAVAVGVVWRRAVPAVVVGFAGYFAVRLFVDLWLRRRLVAPETATWSVSGSDPAGLARSWLINEYPSDRLGRPVDAVTFCAPVPRHARALDPSCLVKHRPEFMHAVFEPASRFWLMQGVETALFCAAAAVLLAFTALWVQRRSA
jgi:hypothetical protein